MEMREAGKGSKQRPTDKKAYDENYDKIFNKKITMPNGEEVKFRYRKEENDTTNNNHNSNL